MAKLVEDLIEVAPTGAALGADIVGVDLSRPLEEANVARLRRAWLDHLVLRFRGQRLDLDAVEAFSRQFGALEKAPITRTGLPHIPDHPYVAVMSNIVENGRTIGSLGAGEAIWHTDMSYNEVAPTASLLYAVEVPPDGGNTNFANMYAAYESLPESVRARIAGLTCRHDSSLNSAGEQRKGAPVVDDPRAAPGAEHPVVRTHPETGRKALFLGRRRNAWLVGLDLAESEALLDELWAHATDPRRVWSQRWQVGDLIMWDNRCTIHHRDPFDPTTRRLMWRTQLQGERPR